MSAGVRAAVNGSGSGTGGTAVRWPLPAPETVLVVCTRVSKPGLLAEEIAYALPPAEQQRIARFHREDDRQRSALAHAIVRHTLAAMHGGRPADIDIVRTADGKPYLPGGTHFSISHSGDLVAAAFCREQSVGVDVEQVNRDIDLDAIAQQMWHASEYAWWRAQMADTRTASFFALWTAKEAMLKALGQGVDRAREVVLPVPLPNRSCPIHLPAGGVTEAWEVHHVAHEEYPLSIAGNRRYPVTVHLV